MRQTIKKACGNIKRTYSAEDFNPFLAMEWIYKNALHTGVGSTVLIVGHTERFTQNILKAWQHVMVSQKIMDASDLQPLLQGNEFVTHTGVRLRFETIRDNDVDSLRFLEMGKTSNVIALCSPYTSPYMMNRVRECTANSLIYDFSKNNIKSVDK